MNLKSKRFRLGLVLLLLILLAIMFTKTILATGYGHDFLSPAERQLPFYSSRDCQVPCWQGLRPGVSTDGDFWSLVNNSPQTLFNNVDCIEFSPNWTQCDWADQIDNLVSRAVFHNGLLKDLNFKPVLILSPNTPSPFGQSTTQDLLLNALSPYDPQARFTLEDVIEILGEPDSFSNEQIMGYDGPQIFLFVLFFDKQDVAITVRATSTFFDTPSTQVELPCETQISKEMAVDHIYFLGPDSFLELEDGKSLPGIVIDTVQPWTGFSNAPIFKACWN